jgi:hypothetical protein
MSNFDAWLDSLTEHIRPKAPPQYKAVAHSCDDHLGAEFCAACGEEVDEDGNTESRFEYCSRHCGCVGPGCPMGGKQID